MILQLSEKVLNNKNLLNQSISKEKILRNSLLILIIISHLIQTIFIMGAIQQILPNFKVIK